MFGIGSDLRVALRALYKRPGFTLVALALLSLGIGANAALYSVVDTVLLRPLPYPEPDRLVMLDETYEPAGLTSVSVSAPDFLDWKARSQSFESLAAYQSTSFTVTEGGEPERLEGVLTTPELFGVLGVAPALGRTLTVEDSVEGRDMVVVLGHGLWQRRFGGSMDIVGRQVSLNGSSRTVVGVMPRGFEYPEKVALWVPETIQMGAPGERLNHQYLVVARLRPGVTVEASGAELATIASQLSREHPEENTGIGSSIRLLHEQLVGDLRPMLLAMLGAVGFVLLIACANLANLLLARAAGRQREFAVRAALGAGRLRLARQLLLEALVLSFCGAALGLGLAWVSQDVLLALSPVDLPRIGQARIGWSAAGFTVLLGALTALAFGIVPALQLRGTDLRSVLQRGGRNVASGSHRRLRGALVVVEVALSAVLLSGAGLLLQSLNRLMSVEPGFEARGVLSARVFLPSQYAKGEQRSAFYNELLSRAEALPSIESAAVVSHLPMTESNWQTLALVEGTSPATLTDIPVTLSAVASASYFKTIGVPLLRGRDFNDGDQLDAPNVAIINETMAKRLFAGLDALGRRFKQGREQDDEPWLTVVGVAGDMREEKLGQEPRPAVWLPVAQRAFGSMAILLRSKSDNPGLLAAPLREALKAVDPQLPLAEVRSLEGVIAGSLAKERFSALLLGTFAGAALLLALVGLYGVLSYVVTQRTPELGIRMALGARPATVLRLVVREGMLLAGLGLVLGMVAAAGLTRVLASLLYGISATDPATFGSVGLVLASGALLACALPARKASRVDPMIALRHE